MNVEVMVEQQLMSQEQSTKMKNRTEEGEKESDKKLSLSLFLD